MGKLLLIGLLVVTIGCNKSGGGGVVSPSEPISNGLYDSCENDPGNTLSLKNEVFLDDNFISEVLTFYTGANCNTGNELINERYVYSYSKSGTEFTLTVQSANMTPFTPAMVTENNDLDFCEYNDWALGVPKNIIDQDCGGFSLSRGDGIVITAHRSGNKLVIKSSGTDSTYVYQGGWNFSSQGSTIIDSNYSYFNGRVGIFASLSAPNYTVTYYDQYTRKSYTEYGTFNSSNNVMNLTVTSYSSPCGTVNVPETKKFSMTGPSLALQEPTGEATLYEKVRFTNAQFAASYLEGTFTEGCF